MFLFEIVVEMEKIIYNLMYILNMKILEFKKMLFLYLNVVKLNKNICLGKYLGLDCKCLILNFYCLILYVFG